MQSAADAEGKRLLTFTLETEVRFAEPGDVHAFTDALTEAVRRTVAEFDSRGRAAVPADRGRPPGTPSYRRRLMSEDRPQIVVTVAAPVEAVWDALRDKQKIRHWHGWEYEGPEGGLDEEIDLIYFTRAVEEGTTLTLGNGDEFVVEPVEGGARITLTRAPRGADPEWEAYYDDVTEGWTTFLNQLRFAVERHPGEARHTLFYSGTGPVSPMAELGISAGPAGSSYELELVGRAGEGRGLVHLRAPDRPDGRCLGQRSAGAQPHPARRPETRRRHDGRPQPLRRHRPHRARRPLARVVGAALPGQARPRRLSLAREC